MLDSATSWTTAHQASLSITNSWSLPKLMSIDSVMPSSHLILYRPLLLLSPIPPSIRVFSNESTLRMRWPKYWSFSFSISPSNEQSIPFRMDWLDLLAVQGTLKSLLQHHSSKATILRHSAFFTVQLSHPYMTTGKTIALTRKTFVGSITKQVTEKQTKSQRFTRQTYWSAWKCFMEGTHFTVLKEARYRRLGQAKSWKWYGTRERTRSAVAVTHRAEVRPRGATPRLRSGAATKGTRLRRQVRRGNLVQGKEQWLCFAGAALKRYPTSKVRETQVRW